MEKLNHRHLLVKAYVHKPPKTPSELNTWLLELVDLIKMKVFMPPNSVICTTPGNEGITGIVGLETSHCSAHFWEIPGDLPFVQFDLYSCQHFEVQDVLDKLDEFDVNCASYWLVDRNDFAPKLIDYSEWMPIPIDPSK